eukprot:4130-Heterococcus_DN1.PRE.2
MYAVGAAGLLSSAGVYSASVLPALARKYAQEGGRDVQGVRPVGAGGKKGKKRGFMYEQTCNISDASSSSNSSLSMTACRVAVCKRLLQSPRHETH